MRQLSIQPVFAAAFRSAADERHAARGIAVRLSRARIARRDARRAHFGHNEHLNDERTCHAISIACVTVPLRSLFQLNPGPWRWRLAAEAGIAMALVIGSWTLGGLQSYGLVASLGAFTILYGSEWSRRERAEALPLFGVGLLMAAAIGVACSINITLSVIGLLFVTVVSTATTLSLGIGPPGPLMFVLVSGVSGYIAGHVRAGGGPLTPSMIPALVASGAVVSYLVAVAPLLWSWTDQANGGPRGTRELFRFVGFSAEAKVIGARVVAGATVAALLGAQLGIQRVYWVVVPAVAILQKSHSSHITSSRALHRVFGTAVGLGVFWLVHRLSPHGLWVVALIASCQWVVEVVVARNYALALVFVTPLALTISLAGNPTNPGLVMGARLIDTALGASVALAALWLASLLPAVRDTPDG
jgi:Fusaric acid resistance protein-like